MGRLSGKDFMIGIAIAFFLFQAVSFILAEYFPQFQVIVDKFPMMYLGLILLVIILIVGTLALKVKDLSGKNIFFMILALAILGYIIVKFNLDLGRLFDTAKLASMIPLI